MAYAFLLLLAVLAAWAMFAFNRLVRLRNQVRTAWADIDVQLQRRHDLIPNLVNTVKGYAAHEKTTLEEVTAARAAAVSAQGAAAERDLDLVAVTVEGQVRVFVNTTPIDDRHHWLRVKLAGRGGNRQAIGALVVAEWEGGRASAEIRTAGGYQAAVPAEAHFGLGPVAKVARLRVRWPSGVEQSLTDVAVDRVLVVEEPER